MDTRTTDGIEPLPTIQVDKEKLLEIWNKWMEKYPNLIDLLAPDDLENYDEQDDMFTL